MLRRAYRSIDQKLAADNAVGEIRESRAKTSLIEFPGRTRSVQLVFGPFNQPGSLDGQLIRVGGEQEIVPVHLREHVTGKVHICQINKHKARKISPYLFGQTLRVFGVGRWERDADGQWQMPRFTIDRFQVLDDTPLEETIQNMRAIEGDLKKIEDPLDFLKELRGG